jgi:DNA-binding NtrC family response regulator
MADTTTPRGEVLVVDDRESVLELMARVLGEAHAVTTTADPNHAMVLLARSRFDVLLTDIRMPQASGFELLAAAKRCAHPPRVVMMTGFACVPDAVAAMRQGAFDYLPKPLEAEEIALVVARALQEPEAGAEGGTPGAARGDASPAGATSRAGGAIGMGSPGGGGLGEGDGVAMVFHDAVAAARDRASRDYLVALMRQFHGNVTHAATRAGITRESLHRLLKKYDVRSESFKTPIR